MVRISTQFSGWRGVRRGRRITMEDKNRSEIKGGNG